ncbi:Uncharacterised protein [[Clostridium] sordellii]|uniref:hypothetical protein n=1 Tax=Paraclostridium sordellii TaxID=1505 RepID=UPI0005E2B616|nr:hypothetical protein [Paeniclostridium sordellii]CEP45724.1 Uncharacterised protein [[Clostridium] sordellii] [Paeniclostridium sordellii]
MNEIFKEIIKSIGDLNSLLWGLTLIFTCMSLIINPKKLYDIIDELLVIFLKGMCVGISRGITYLSNNNSLEYILLFIMMYSAIKAIDYFICAISYRIVKKFELKILNE